MKRLLAVLMLCACGAATPDVIDTPVEVEAQSALIDVTHALIAGDMDLFKSRLKLEADEPDDMPEVLMKTVRDGLRTHYDDKTPQIVEIKDEGYNRYSASLFVPKFNAVSPKRVFFWRDPDTKRMFWTGMKLREIEVGQVNTKKQALNIVISSFDIWNQNTSVFHFLNSEFDTRDGLTCFIGTDICSNVNPVVSVCQGCSGTVNLNANAYGSQNAIARVNPAIGTCACSTHSSTATGNCCWTHPWGWDFWWPGSDSNPSNGPTCGSSGFCPP